MIVQHETDVNGEPIAKGGRSWKTYYAVYHDVMLKCMDSCRSRFYKDVSSGSMHQKTMRYEVTMTT